MTVAVTEAPAMTGAPIIKLPSAPTASTSVKVMEAPASASSFSTFSRALGVTRYCFPPVRMTANIGLASCDALVRSSRPSAVATWVAAAG